MILIHGAIIEGLIFSLLAMGVFISFKIFDFPDITADGSFTTGAAISAAFITAGHNPIIATLAAIFGGFAAGALTGTLHTKFKVNRLLSGILVMIALYSVNLHIMGQPNLNLQFSTTLFTYTEKICAKFFGTPPDSSLWGIGLSVNEGLVFFFALAGIICIGFALNRFFRTHLGMAMRAAGDNQKMIRALGVNVDSMVILGLMVSNGLIALSGALFAQASALADIQVGIGSIVRGLASVIIGQTLVGKRHFGWMIAGAVIGSVVFRLVLALAAWVGLPPNDFRLVTAAFVLIALVLPQVVAKFKESKAPAAEAMS